MEKTSLSKWNEGKVHSLALDIRTNQITMPFDACHGSCRVVLMWNTPDFFTEELWGKGTEEIPVRKLAKQDKHYNKAFKTTHDVKRKQFGRSLGKLVRNSTTMESKNAELSGDDEDVSSSQEEVPADAKSIGLVSKSIAFIDDMITLQNDYENNGDHHQDEVHGSSIFCLDYINEYSAFLYSNDPNFSPASKLEQLKLHDRLHEQYKAGNLSSCLLSVYVDKMTEFRRYQTYVINHGTSSQNSARFSNDVRKRRVYNKLAKVPGDRSILGDRAFYNDAMRYPNLNDQITPKFLMGRKRFNRKELLDDMKLCRLRYCSEVNFSRITNENILSDVIPRSSFSVAHHAIHWAHGAANLCQPFQHNDCSIEEELLGNNTSGDKDEVEHESYFESEL
jgi:hypothetical protein